MGFIGIEGCRRILSFLLKQESSYFCPLILDSRFRRNDRSAKLHSVIIRENRILKIFSLLALIVMCVGVFGRLNTFAQPTEYEVKAAFLYNFVKFVEWPTESLADTTIIVGVLGEDPFGTTIDAIQSKTIREKKLIIKRIKSFQEVKDCHILFISSSEKEHLSQIVKTLKGLSILTVGDTEEFAKRGVIINFYLKEKKVHFEINVEAARRAGLKISSKLLNLSKIVHGAPRDEDS